MEGAGVLHVEGDWCAAGKRRRDEGTILQQAASCSLTCVLQDPRWEKSDKSAPFIFEQKSVKMCHPLLDTQSYLKDIWKKSNVCFSFDMAGTILTPVNSSLVLHTLTKCTKAVLINHIDLYAHFSCLFWTVEKSKRSDLWFRNTQKNTVILVSK